MPLDMKNGLGATVLGFLAVGAEGLMLHREASNVEDAPPGSENTEAVGKYGGLFWCAGSSCRRHSGRADSRF